MKKSLNEISVQDRISQIASKLIFGGSKSEMNRQILKMECQVCTTVETENIIAKMECQVCTTVETENIA